MHPVNVHCLQTAEIDNCSLANNHVLDWGYEGLTETIGVLDDLKISSSGAGRNVREAASPAIIEVYNNKLILYGCGDFSNDYEGTGGHENFRSDLGLIYFATLDAITGGLVQLRLAPTRTNISK